MDSSSTSASKRSRMLVFKESKLQSRRERLRVPDWCHMKMAGTPMQSSLLLFAILMLHSMLKTDNLHVNEKLKYTQELANHKVDMSTGS